MNKLLITFILLLSSVLYLQGLEQSIDHQSFTANGISFSLNPTVIIRQSDTDIPLRFNSQHDIQGNVYHIKYANEYLDIDVYLRPTNELYIPAWECKVQTYYHTTCDIHDLWISLDFNRPVTEFTGLEACVEQNSNKNRKMYPYTERIAKYVGWNGSMWILGAYNLGLNPVEVIESNNIKLFDRRFHSLDLTSFWNRKIDWMPKSFGDQDTYGFMIFEQKPLLLDFNLYPSHALAALAITNDADQESTPKLQATYYGSSNPNSSAYGNSGLVYHQIPVSNTVFGENYAMMNPIWTSIHNDGNSIGSHTWSPEADNFSDLSYSLLDQMQDYNIRLWIDHSPNMNPETICNQGWMQDSPYYIFDLLQEAQIDYCWTYSQPTQNYMNSFDDVGMLPHTVPALNLERPIHFFGRWRTEGWEYYTAPQYDFKHNVTAPNLDTLIKNHGLAVLYTHLSFTSNPSRAAFYDVLNGVFSIKPEVEERLALLDSYRSDGTIWFDTAENIFDRMVAMEKVYLLHADRISHSMIRFSLQNDSALDIRDFTFKYQGRNYSIDLLPAHSATSLDAEYLEDMGAGSVPQNPNDDFFIYPSGSNLLIKDHNGNSMKQASVDVYNIKGQNLHLPATTSNNMVDIDFSKCKAGIYILRVALPGQSRKAMKFSWIPD